MITTIGLFAAALTTTAGLPQLFMILKTKRTNDLSLTMLIMMVVGLSAWLIYGILKLDLPLILSNIFAVIIQFSMLYLKIKNER